MGMQNNADEGCSTGAQPADMRFGKKEDVRDGQGTGHVPFGSLPYLALVAGQPMRLFDPAADLSEVAEAMDGRNAAFQEPLTLQEYPFTQDTTPQGGNIDPVETEGMGFIGAMPPLPLLRATKQNPKTVFIPREEDCYALWDRYRMPHHIRRHSQRVADLAAGIARLDAEQGSLVNPDAVYAAGLLHDLGKAYCIAHGGNHAEVGSAWVMRETRNGPIAQGVLFHVHWPWDETLTDNTMLVLTILYADKRVTHDAYVSLDERYVDLFARYGITETARTHIASARDQGKRIEAALSRRLGVNLHEYTAYRGRLVNRA